MPRHQDSRFFHRGALAGTTLLGLTALAFTPAAVADPTGTAMAQAANQFLASLDEKGKTKATFKVDDEERLNWHYIPTKRKGLPIKDMTPVQTQLTFALVSTGMSSRGFTQATTIMTLEHILWQLENKSPKRDPEGYFVSIFGTPANDSAWGWRFEGHHLSINFTLKDGKVVSGTPIFFATNPAEVLKGPRKGLRVLAREEDLGLALVTSLDDAAKKKALVDKAPPRDILTSEKRKVQRLEPAGLPASEMNEKQRAILKELITEYVFRHRPELALADLAAIEKAGHDKIFFAWAGGMKRGEGHYYRVQGPHFLLEYANTQNNANHVHAVWRNFDGDFGKDVLAEHFLHEHRDQGVAANK